MSTKPGVGSRDAAQGVAKTTAHRFAGAFDGVGRPAGPAGEAVGGGQLGDQGVELLTGGGTRFCVARSWASSIPCSNSVIRRW